MIRSFPFDAVLDSSGIPDRAYLSIDFAKYFSKFISNGVFPNPSTGLQVIAVDNNMQVRIKKGDGYIEGRLFENTDDYIFKLEPADGVLNRIDRVVLRLDYLKRDIILVLKKGDYASSPVPKNLQRDADAYEIALADIYVRAGVIAIIQSNITDLRFNKELCGLVHATVEQIDPTVIFNQFQSWYKQKQDSYDNDISKWTIEKKEAFNNWYNTNTQAWGNEFQTWFDTLKDKLDGDVATKLTADVESLKSQIAEKAKQTDLNALSKNFTNFKNSKGQPNGLASLGLDGKVASTQLPPIENSPWMEIKSIILKEPVQEIIFENLNLEKYKILKIYFNGKQTEYSITDVCMNFNDDKLVSNANYEFGQLFSGTTYQRSYKANLGGISNQTTSFECEIQNSDKFFKSFFCNNRYIDSGHIKDGHRINTWFNTDKIRKISISIGSNKFNTDTTIILMGVK